MPPTPAQSALLDEAITLMMRRTSPADSTIAAWRARSADHEAVWQMVAKAHGISGRVLSPPRNPTRRNVVLGGAALLGAGALGAWTLPEMRQTQQADHVTTTAQLLNMALPDGSHATLGPDSAVITGARGFRLLRGMAWVDVAPAAAPFVVQLPDGVSIQTTSATFEIARDAHLVNLAVSTDGVDLRSSLQSRAVSAGHWLRLNPKDGAYEEGPRDPALAGLWQQGLIAAEAEPLDVLVARIARWMPGRVVIADRAIARARISGLFDTSNPTRALQAAVRPTGGHVRGVSGFLTVISIV
ncbi:FecR protein (plasmid) [Ketogulonicigenium robustum]|uniref:FecR protein n=1 Tax=Ketogulonicigenium robustum TaxID=92947 RepID=A0A1W6P3M0_9RHOB|nr:FecR domain-containing protein [Ketogulonicigenium robustum]ARO15937.1 FecR protein [Ketogulonicigenium robustum]